MVFFLSACSTPTPIPDTSTSAPTKFALVASTDTPTATITPSVTPTLVPSATPTVTRTRTRTATPTSTIKLSTVIPTSTSTSVKPTTTPIIFGDEAYGAISTISSSAPHPAAEMNLAARGSVTTTALLDLVDIDGPLDPFAPHLYSLFSDKRIPPIKAVYQLYRWDELCSCRGALYDTPQVTMASVVVNSSEMLRVPESGYNLGEGYNAIILYADSQRVTFAYTRDDNPVRGYVIYLEGVAVEANLLALYQEMDRSGRGALPGLKIGQAFARTISTELKFAVRDAGGFMDPRSRKDWWRK